MLQRCRMYSDALCIPSWPQMFPCQSDIGITTIYNYFMRLPHKLVHDVFSVLDLFEGFVCVETVSLVLDVRGVECHHLESAITVVC